MELNETHAVVTGASAGIGRALALEFARAGARVTLVARREAALESLAAQIRAEGLPEALVLCVDLTSDDDSWLDRAVEERGPVEVLVNNAGVQVISPTHSVDVAAGERSVALNLLVPLRLTRAVLPAMRQAGRGVIINIASMAALAPTPSMTYYNAAKAGLAGASEALRGELHGTGVDVLTVYPGIIDTDMAAAGLERYESSLAVRLQPRGDTTTLAGIVRRATERRRARVVYPRANVLARWFPAITRWTLDTFTPRLSAPGA